MHLLALLVVSFCASVHAFQRIHHTQRSRKNHKVLISLPETQLRRDEIKCSTRLSFSEVDDNTEDDTKSVRKSGRHLALDDYAQIIEALRIYKKNFNDLDIPVKFEVPAEDPWPSAIHGLRLGKRLQKLFLSSDFFEKHTEKVAEIESIGLVPSVDSLVDDWFMIYKALQTYKDLYGDTRVSAKFVVPAEDPWPKVCHNLKLGTRIAAVRSAGRYVKDRPERKAQLEAMGFEWRIRDHTHKQLVGEELFEQVFQALIIYKKNVSEKLNVPVNFTVPNEGPWPQDMWGLQLGVIVRGIREENKLVYGHANRVQRLNELGFPWEETTREVYSKNRFEVIISALLVYEGMYGDMYVPQSFVVPEESPWPESSWGVKLGARVNAIRSQGTFVSNSPERRAVLDDIGFPWEFTSEVKKRKKEGMLLSTADESPGDADDWSYTTAAATIKNKKLSDVILQKVKEDRKLVKDSASQKLGNFENAGRNVDLLFNKGVLHYDPSRIFETVSYREIAAEAMKDYMKSREYSNDPAIREIAHFEGRLSPQKLNSIITRSIPDEDIIAMKAIGYRILEFGKFNWNLVLDALHIYKNAFGNVDVPYDYEITAEVIVSNVGFEDRHEGLLLGEIVNGIRIGDIDGYEDTVRRSELDALKFIWGDMRLYQRYRFIPMLLGLKIYKHLYGFPMPQSDFLVPDEPQWPYWMVNMPLGEWTAVARIQQKLIAEHYNHRKEMLDAMEFLWWIPPSGTIPMKYYKQLV